MQDRDSSLFPSLLEGVRTGFQAPIPASGVFPPSNPTEVISDPLSIHLTNWQSAQDDPQLTAELVQEEIDKGWVFQFDGSVEDAQAQFPLGLSIGKLGVATAEGRPPRLVVDSSVCGLNGRCSIPEKSTLPTAREIARSFPLRGTNKCLSGFSLDVKSAHKRIVLHPDERGLVDLPSMKNFISIMSPLLVRFSRRPGGHVWVDSSYTVLSSSDLDEPCWVSLRG